MSDSVVCFLANDKKLLTSGVYGKREETFLTKGFVNWKGACASFRKHEASRYHIDAVQVIGKPQNNVGDVLSQAHSEQKKINSRMLMTMMQNIQHLGQQGFERT